MSTFFIRLYCFWRIFFNVVCDSYHHRTHFNTPIVLCSAIINVISTCKGGQSPLRDPFRHADGAGGADEAAEVATCAFGAGNAGLAALRVEGDGLVSAVAAGEEAASATGAFFTVNSGEDHGVAVKVGGEGEGGQQLANNLFKVSDAALLHICLQAKNKVIDDAVPVLHHGCAHLYVSAAYLYELQCVVPCLNAADTAELHFVCLGLFRVIAVCSAVVPAVHPVQDGVLRHFKYKAQGDGLHRTA